MRKSFLQLLKEAEQKTLLIITSLPKDRIEKDGTFSQLLSTCDRLGVRGILCTNDAFLDEDVKDKIVLKQNGKTITCDPKRTIVYTKALAKDCLSGNAIRKSAVARGARSINENSISGNKYENYVLFRQNEIPTPKTVLAASAGKDVISPENEATIKRILKEIGKFPIFLKTIPGSRGVGVSVVESEKALRPALQTIWALGGTAIAQEALNISSDLRVFVINGKALCAIKRNMVKSDVRTNVSQGASYKEVDLKDDIKVLAEKVASLLKLDIAGVDVAIVPTRGMKPEYFVLEVNAAPDMDFKCKEFDVIEEFLKRLVL